MSLIVSPTSCKSEGSAASKCLAAWALLRMAVSGWFNSWAKDVASSPIVATRLTCARSCRCRRNSASVRLRSLIAPALEAETFRQGRISLGLRLNRRGRLAPPSLFSSATAAFALNLAELFELIPKDLASGDHAALEHFIRNRAGHAVEKLRAHLRIFAHHLHHFLLDHLLPRRGWSALLLGQFLAGRTLIFLDDLLGYLIHNRILLGAGYSKLKQQGR